MQIQQPPRFLSGSRRLFFCADVPNALQRLVGSSRLPSNGVEVLWNPVNRRVKTWEREAPAEPPHADPLHERLPAILQSSRDRCSARGMDAAQQELRPPGTCSCQKVNAIGLTPGNQLRQTKACVLEPDPQCLSERIQQSASSSMAVMMRSNGSRW